MLDNKETTQNYFKGLTRKDYIERVCKIMEKDGAEDLSIRNRPAAAPTQVKGRVGLPLGNDRLSLW